MPRKRRQVAMKPSRAIQALRRMKNMQPDDLGDLEFLLSSETSPLVRCNNHSFTVAMQKQMDIWYRHHVITMRKLSQGQQGEYRNLMKVKNDIRRMYRSGVMRHREEDEFDIRMKIDRDRNDALTKLLDLTLEDDETGVEDEIDLARKEADRSGWLRIRRQDVMNSSEILPTIHDINDEQRRDSSTFGEIDDEDLEYTDKGIAGNDYDEQIENSNFKSEGHNANDVNISTLESTVSTHNAPDDDDGAEFLPDDLPTTDRSGHASNDAEAKQIQTVDQANKSYQYHADEKQSSKYISDSHRQKKPFNLVDSGAKFSKHHNLDGKMLLDHDVRNMKTSDVVLTDSGDQQGKMGDARSDSAMENDVRRRERSMVAIHPVTDLISKRSFEDLNAGSDLQGRQQAKTNLVENRKIHEWGPTNKRVQKLPSLHLQPIDQVIRYQRQEKGRDLVGTVIAVKPSAENFPMPSKKSEYCRRKALQWHVEQAPALHTKIQQFLSECDAVPRPPSSLQKRPVFFFSRHNPIVTMSTGHTSTVHGADAMTSQSNEVQHDVETITREGANSVILGHSVAITKEMVNRKHGVVTPHK